jgi:hypothetical protein
MLFILAYFSYADNEPEFLAGTVVVVKAECPSYRTHCIDEDTT